MSIVYRVIASAGNESRDILLVGGGTASMESLFDDPVGVRLLEGLSDLGRLVVFDRCGIGLSDPPDDWNEPAFAGWLQDVEAVVVAAEVVRPVVVSSLNAAVVALAYCVRHPDDVTSMVFLEPSPPGRFDPEHVRAQIAGEIDSVALLCPSRADEPGFREWFTRAGQSGASPRLAARAYPIPNDDQVREIEEGAACCRIPTLVLRRPAHFYSPDRSNDRFLALVAGAVRVDLPGEDLSIYGGEVDALLAEASRFVTGSYRAPSPQRVLAAVMYSDLVASTERATSIGDAHWKRLVDRHDEVAHSCVGRRGGAVIKTTGDGVLATFPSATNAIRAAQEIRAALVQHDLHMRVGIHVGEIDQRGNDISGIAVTIAARVMAHAGPGEILVSHAVPPAITGSDIEFHDRGMRRLKGIAETWRVYTVADLSAGPGL